MPDDFNVETGAPKKRHRPDALTSLHFDLARMLPALWGKAHDRNLTATEQHKKLLALLVWAAGKQGVSARHRAPIQFWQDQVKRDGLIDVLLLDSNDAPALYVELDWKLNEASLHKLQAASVAHRPVLWVCGVNYGTKAQAKAARAFANATMGKPTGWWLPIFHLDHGWV